MSRRASLYVAGILLLGAISIGFAVYRAGAAAPDWVAFVVLLILAIPAQLYEAEHGRQSYYPHFVCFFAGVLLLPPYLFALIVIIPHVVEWAYKRRQRGEHLRAWYIQPFNIATHLVAGSACFVLVATTHGGVSRAASLPPVVIFSAAALIYVLINHLIVGGVLLLARGISFAESRVVAIDSLLPDFILACLGTLIAVLWTIDPGWIVLALLPLVLMYQALHVPQLKQEAQTDSKTGLLNARYFTKLATTAVAEAQRSATPITLIMADLDYLRTINNTYGHLAGDVVITGIAKIIRETIHDQDIAARFGGEEFTIALPGTDLAGAAALGERLRQTIEQTEFVIPSGTAIHATISMGIACFPQDGATLTDLTHAADIAVYYAKFLGRNRVVSTPDVPHATKMEYLASRGGDQIAPATPQAALAPTPHAHPAPAAVPPRDGGERAVTAAPSSEGARAARPPPPMATAAGQAQRARAPRARVTPSAAFQRRYLGIFVSVVMSCGVGVTLLGIRQSPGMDLLVVGLFAALAVLAEAFQVDVYGDNTASVSVSLVFAAALLGGIAGVACVSAALVVTHAIKKRVPLYKTAFNWSTHVLAGMIPIIVLTWLAIPLRFDTLPMLMVPFVLAAVGYYVIDTGLVAGAMSLATGARLRTLWHDQFRWLAWHYLILCLIGAFTAIAVSTLGRWGILICILPLFLARYAQAQYIARTEASTAELRRMNRELQAANGTIVGASAAIQQLNQELTDLNDQLFETLARFFDARDPYVGGHAAKVADYAEAIARELGIAPEQRKLVRQAGYLHDIGKIAIPERILHKPGTLTAEEYIIIKTHATLGADLLELSSGLQPLARFVRYHHERWDGHGYPHGLRGADIPLESRILNLCDSVEAMASDRPYHHGKTPQEVIAEVARCAGTQFDPAVAAAFLRVVEREGAASIVNSAHSVSSQRPLLQQPAVYHQNGWRSGEVMNPAASGIPL